MVDRDRGAVAIEDGIKSNGQFTHELQKRSAELAIGA